MSQETADIVRERLKLRPSAPGRRFEDHLTVRFPRLASAVSRTVMRLPLHSRLRRALMRRTVEAAWQALNRRDLDVLFAFYDSEVESEFDPGLVSLGLADTSGRRARMDLQRDVFATMDLRFESEELIFVGPSRLLTLGRMKGSGSSSGAAFDTDWAALVTMADGRVKHERIFLSHGQALEAVGLSE